VGAELNLVGRVGNEAAVTDVEGLAGGSVPAVQNGQVETTGSRSRQLRNDPVVHTVDVGPSELLGLGNDGGELLRGDRANAVAQLAAWLFLGLSNRLDLGLSGAEQDRSLAAVHRERVASQTLDNALVLAGLVNHGNELARQALGGQISQSSHFVFSPLLSLGAADELRQHRAWSIGDNVALPETLRPVDGARRLAGDAGQHLRLLGR